MNEYLIKAYADRERHLKEKKKTIHATNNEEALRIAWATFLEYKELGIYLISENIKMQKSLDK